MRLNRSLVLTALCGLSASPALAQGISQIPAAPSNDHPVRSFAIQSFGSDGDCNIIDFEGIGNNVPIGTLLGPVDVTFGPSWNGLIDADAGGTGNIANEPSPDTVAYFVASNDPIDFSEGVNFVEVTYSAAAISIPVTLLAYDGPSGTGNVVGMATGSTVGTQDGGASCTGDPGGNFCMWDTMGVSTPGNTIRSIVLQGAVANQFGFDNMTFCRDTVSDNFCTSLPNSTGLVGGMIAGGSNVATDNDVTLTAFNLPLNQMGYVLNSMNTGMTPVGDGILCLGAGKGRHTTQIADSGATGTIETILNLTALPRSSSPPASVMAGETWYFQLWHRDGMSSNFTNGVAITFQ